jgi:hypothetical protein
MDGGRGRTQKRPPGEPGGLERTLRSGSYEFGLGGRRVRWVWFIQKPMPVMGRYHALPTTEVLETTAGAVAAHTTAAGAAPTVRARAAVVNMATTKPRRPFARQRSFDEVSRSLVRVGAEKPPLAPG